VIALPVPCGAGGCWRSRPGCEKQGVKFHAGGDAGPMVRRMRPLYEPLWASADPLSRQALGLVLRSLAGR
jgi:hypothetical protein